MKEYKNSKELLSEIHTLKKYIRTLYKNGDYKTLDIKKEFYSQKLSNEVKDWFWNYIWDDITLQDLQMALHLYIDINCEEIEETEGIDDIDDIENMDFFGDIKTL